MFAKPFLGALDGPSLLPLLFAVLISVLLSFCICVSPLTGHRDGVHCVTIHPKKLSVILSGSYDGEVRAWNLGTRRCLYSATLHEYDLP